ncbi:MAG TPA: hypothetical protein VNO21_11255, partial [Polyangiaceae bacterium]|nr:hypothetical protein [Polyangiaceae bacterium]
MAGNLRNQAKTWAFVAVPALALIELGAHVAQVHGAIGTDDWAHAREEARALAKADDLVIFAPRWSDPIGREAFGDDLATPQREAWADVSRFPRAIEVSIRGQHAPELAGWKSVASQRAGGITLTTLENPSYRATKTDLVALLRPALDSGSGSEVTIHASDGRGERPCTWGQGPAQSGNLG